MPAGPGNPPSGLWQKALKAGGLPCLEVRFGSVIDLPEAGNEAIRQGSKRPQSALAPTPAVHTGQQPDPWLMQRIMLRMQESTGPGINLVDIGTIGDVHPDMHVR